MGRARGHGHHVRAPGVVPASGPGDEAELAERGHAVVQADLLGDEAVLDLQHRGAGEPHRPAGAGRQRPVGHVVERVAGLGAAAFPLADHVVAFRDQVGGAPEVQVGKRGAELLRERADRAPAAQRLVQRVLEPDVRGGQLVDDGRVELLAPELREPAAHDRLVLLSRHDRLLVGAVRTAPLLGTPRRRRPSPFREVPAGNSLPSFPPTGRASPRAPCPRHPAPVRRPRPTISARRGSPTGMVMSAFDEATLLENARLGDEHAFAELTGTYQGELRSYCYRMLGSVQDAEDAVQNALLRAWRGLDKFEGRSSIRSWLYSIATNTTLDITRHRSRRELPTDFGPAATVGAPVEEAVNDPIWLEPYPDQWLAGQPDVPRVPLRAAGERRDRVHDPAPGTAAAAARGAHSP